MYMIRTMDDQEAFQQLDVSVTVFYNRIRGCDCYFTLVPHVDGIKE